jgi:hypothetical protein
VEEATYEVVEDPEALWTGDVPEEFLRGFEMRSLSTIYMTLVVGWLERLAGEARGQDRRGWAWSWRDTWRCRWV